MAFVNIERLLVYSVNCLNSAVFVVLELAYLEAVKAVDSLGRHAVVMEKPPFTFELHDTVVSGPAYHRSKNLSLVSERSIRIVSDSIADTVSIAGRVAEIILSVVLVEPAGLEEAALVVSCKKRLAVLIENHHIARIFRELEHVT